MPTDERFVLLPHLLSHVLPGLVRGPALTHLVATYNWIGTRPPTMPTEIAIDDGFVQILLHQLTTDRVTHELPGLLRDHADPEIPLLAAVYCGRSGFLQMLAVIREIRSSRNDARIVVAACGCLTDDQQYFLRSGVETGTIDYVVWVECNGSKSMGLIRDEIATIRLATNARPVPAKDDSPSLGA